jgi:DNA-binding response OmpR family regulator
MDNGRNLRILIFNDSSLRARLLRRSLEKNGYSVITGTNSTEIRQAIEEKFPILAIIPRFTADTDGLTLCREIRQWSQIPIIMFSESVDVADIVLCLDAGADDYIEKTVSSKELTARIKALVRRSRIQAKLKDSNFHCIDLTIDYTGHRVTRGNKDVTLTALEYKLICYLACNAGRILTTGQILSTIWGENYSGETHLLQVNINRLRQKLSDSAREPRYIITKSGVGYVMKNSR